MSVLDNLSEATEESQKRNITPPKTVKIGNGSNDPRLPSFQEEIVPKHGWIVKEDYIINEDTGAINTVLLVFEEPGKATRLPVQWGVEYINSLVSDVIKHKATDDETQKSALDLNVTFINTVRVMSQKWVHDQQTNTDRWTERKSDIDDGSHSEEAEVETKQQDIAQIAYEINKGASYLGVGLKYVVSAKNLDILKDFIDTLQTKLKQDIPGTILALPNGNIEREFQDLFNSPMEEPGMKSMFTSVEYAGFYNLVTQGIEDDNGSYMGEQRNDINETAVIWDMTNFDRYAVLGISNSFERIRDQFSRSVPDRFHGFNGSDLWLNCLTLQLVREKQGRVFTLALDPIHLTGLLNGVTSFIDLNSGTINPFEMFGQEKDELAIYNANTEKWNIMARQLANFTIQSVNAVQQEPLTQTEIDDLDTALAEFYEDHGMWVKNAKYNRKNIHIVNVPHKQVPTLKEFVTHLKIDYMKYADPDNGEIGKAAEYDKLHSIFNRLLTTSGDIFDTHTSPIIDSLGTSRNTVFDYSQLSSRSDTLLLAQLLNSISAISNQMRMGDVLIIHGAQRITNLTKSYIQTILNDLITRNIRIVFSYNNIDDMLEDQKFNHLSSADYVLTGYLTADQVTAYNKALGNQRRLADNISSGIQMRNNARYYLRRGPENILFDANPYL